MGMLCTYKKKLFYNIWKQCVAGAVKWGEKDTFCICF